MHSTVRLHILVSLKMLTGSDSVLLFLSLPFFFYFYISLQSPLVPLTPVFIFFPSSFNNPLLSSWAANVSLLLIRLLVSSYY